MVINKYLLSVFVRLFLEKNENSMMKFISDFQKLIVSDEKVSVVHFSFYSLYLSRLLSRKNKLSEFMRDRG